MSTIKNGTTGVGETAWWRKPDRGLSPPLLNPNTSYWANTFGGSML